MESENVSFPLWETQRLLLYSFGSSEMNGKKINSSDSSLFLSPLLARSRGVDEYGRIRVGGSASGVPLGRGPAGPLGRRVGGLSGGRGSCGLGGAGGGIRPGGGHVRSGASASLGRGGRRSARPSGDGALGQQQGVGGVDSRDARRGAVVEESGGVVRTLQLDLVGAALGNGDGVLEVVSGEELGVVVVVVVVRREKGEVFFFFFFAPEVESKKKKVSHFCCFFVSMGGKLFSLFSLNSPC